MVTTREKGKNSKLISALETHGFSCLELPLIRHADGPDLKKLPGILLDKEFDWVTVTSPQAAEVLCEAWKAANSPKLRVATVGKATSMVLEAAGIEVEFVPSKSNADVLSQELPEVGGRQTTVLYPASARAKGELEMKLKARDFQVTRMNTYDTLPVDSVPSQDLQEAIGADVVAFGSPSAIKAWKQVSGEIEKGMMVACIGETSGKAALKEGFENVFYPEKPGLDGWVESIVKAVGQVQG